MRSETARHLFLSPHHDDICFSLGETAGNLGDGLLLNVFSISSYIAIEPPPTADRQQEVSELRDEEDRRFAVDRGLNRRNLGQLDCPLRGYEAFDTSGVADEVLIFRPTVLEALETEHENPPARPLLFCPAAIGEHRDHLLLRDCVVADYERLSARYRIVFYEDLHYASVLSKRDSGLHNLSQVTTGLGYSIRYRFKVSRSKLDLLRLYASQFYEPPVDLSRFIPADGSGEPHEAVWANMALPELDRLGQRT